MALTFTMSMFGSKVYNPNGSKLYVWLQTKTIRMICTSMFGSKTYNPSSSYNSMVVSKVYNPNCFHSVWL